MAADKPRPRSSLSQPEDHDATVLGALQNVAVASADKALKLAMNRHAQVTVVSAAAGGAAAGTGGGAVGLFAGGILGAAAGILPAFITFGLSIPVGAALGGGCGLLVGAATGAAAGATVGGAAGFGAYPRRAEISWAIGRAPANLGQIFKRSREAAAQYIAAASVRPPGTGETPPQLDAAGKPRLAAATMSKEQVRQILQDMIKDQEKMRAAMKALEPEIARDRMTFEQVYKKVREVQPADCLQRHGLSMQELDQVLERYQLDPIIKATIARMMGPPTLGSAAWAKAQDVRVKDIIDVHSFMLDQLEALNSDFQALPDKRPLDAEIVTLAAQATVGAKARERFGIASEELECAVKRHEMALSVHKEFQAVTANIQRSMSKLMGALSS